MPADDDRTSNEAADFLSRDMDVTPIIRGIEDLERARMWMEEAQRLDVNDKTKQQIARRMARARD